MRTRLYSSAKVSVFIGPLGEATRHSHGAWAWCFGLSRPLTILTARSTRSLTAVRIRAGHDHSLFGHDSPIAAVYFDPSISAGMTEGEIAHPERLLALLNDAYTSTLSTVAFEHELLREIDVHRVEPRVHRTGEYIREHLDENTPLSELARLEGLSADRLRHVFRDSYGLTVRRYRLWHRCLGALTTAVHGESLTYAAHEMGFASSAHFSSQFRAGFGLAPSQILKARGLDLVELPADS